MPTVDQIIAYESGELDPQGTLILFGQLIASGQAWILQGSYGRAATAFIHTGLIGDDGAVDWARAEAVGVERPLVAAEERLCGCGAHHDIHTDEETS